MKPGFWLDRADEAPGRVLERRQAAAGAILHVALKAAAGADARHRRRLEHESEGVGQHADVLADIGEDFGRRQAFLDALLEGLQRDKDDAGVGGVGEGRAVEAGERPPRARRRRGAE